MRLSLIVAMDRHGVIGRAGRLPWRLSADLKRFKELTMGHAIIMGRKTFESLPRLLPGRTSVVVTRQHSFEVPEGALTAANLAAALELAANDAEPFVIGGGELFRQALPHANRLYVTCVEADIEGDTYFPPVDWSQWREVSRERRPADAKNEYDTSFAIYDRIAAENA